MGRKKYDKKRKNEKQKNGKKLFFDYFDCVVGTGGKAGLATDALRVVLDDDFSIDRIIIAFLRANFLASCIAVTFVEVDLDLIAHVFHHF